MLQAGTADVFFTNGALNINKFKNLFYMSTITFTTNTFHKHYIFTCKFLALYD
jgi:hypothetical protein